MQSLFTGHLRHSMWWAVKAVHLLTAAPVRSFSFVPSPYPPTLCFQRARDVSACGLKPRLPGCASKFIQAEALLFRDLQAVSELELQEFRVEKCWLSVWSIWLYQMMQKTLQGQAGAKEHSKLGKLPVASEKGKWNVYKEKERKQHASSEKAAKSSDSGGGSCRWITRPGIEHRSAAVTTTVFFTSFQLRNLMDSLPFRNWTGYL